MSVFLASVHASALRCSLLAPLPCESSLTNGSLSSFDFVYRGDLNLIDVNVESPRMNRPLLVHTTAAYNNEHEDDTGMGGEGRGELTLEINMECDIWNATYNSSSIVLRLSQSSSLLISGLRRVPVPKHLGRVA